MFSCTLTEDIEVSDGEDPYRLVNRETFVFNAAFIYFRLKMKAFICSPNAAYVVIVKSILRYLPRLLTIMPPSP